MNPPMRFEYTQIKFETDVMSGDTRFDTDAMTKELNELGDEGWELVSTYTIEKVRGRTKFVIASLKHPAD